MREVYVAYIENLTTECFSLCVTAIEVCVSCKMSLHVLV